MACPVCGGSTVVFRVPEALRADAPVDTPAGALCSSCLTLTPAADDGGLPTPDAADFSRILEAFPGGTPGVAMALAVGLLVDSLALNRAAIERLFDVVSDAGEDPWLVLERLAVAGSVQPEIDLVTARQQLEQLRG